MLSLNPGMTYLKSALTFTLLVLAFSSCKKGFDGNKNTLAPPETYVVVDSVFRTGEDRLTTRVDARWYGVSKGGYIIGYEFSTDNMVSWKFTSRTDSTFLLSLPPGSDSADIAIYFRAIDYLGQKDPTPAGTLFPIKNSPPSAKFVFGIPVAGIPSQNQVKAFPVLKYTIQGDDPDGAADLSGYNLYINDTNQTPYFIPATATSFTLVGLNLQADSTLCSIFLGSNSTPASQNVGYLKLNAFNDFYLQSVDKALSKSAIVKAPSVWVKKVASDVLVINAYNSNKVFVQNFYTARMVNNGILVFDTLQATEVVNNNYTQLAPDFETQKRVFKLFKKIVWFGDDANFSLSLGQRSTSDFFNNGGTMFLSLAINAGFDPLSNFLDWTPVRSLVNPPGGSVFRINNNQTINGKSGYPALKTTKFIDSSRPFEIPSTGGIYGYDSIYSGGILESISGQPPKAWTGISTIVSKRYRTQSGKTDFIFSSVPLENFGGNNNMDSVFQILFKQELGF